MVDHAKLTIQNKDVFLLCSLNGLRKFGYSDSRYGKNNYRQDNKNKIEFVLALEKENGECGHAAAFSVPGPDGAEQRFWLLGSKNVHIIVPFTDGASGPYTSTVLDCYDGMRYGYAKRIAKLFLTTIANAKVDVAALHRAIQENKWTACFESIFPDSQHLVNYHGKTEIRFFAISRCDATPVSTNGPYLNSSCRGLCEDIFLAKSFFNKFNLYFSSINYGAGDEKENLIAFDSPEYSALVEDISKRHNSEGCVMYGFYYQDDEEGNKRMNVCRVWKQKAYPYVMERAAREQIASHKRCGGPLREKLMEKLNSQPEELRAYFSEWERDRLPFLVMFAAYLQIQKKIKSFMTNDETFAVRNNWLTLQDEFSPIYHCGVSSEIIELCKRYESTIDEKQTTDGVDNVEVIKFIGAQGSGKSTLARGVFVLLRNIPATSGDDPFLFNPCWANQDECGGNRTKFLNVIKNCCAAGEKSNGKTHIIIDKMNLDKRMNDDYKFLNKSIITSVYFYHEDGKKALVDLLYDRVMGRGEGHRTIKVPERTENNNTSAKEIEVMKKNILGFIHKAVSSCEKPDSYINGEDGERAENSEDIERTLLSLEVTIPLEEMLILIWEKMKQNSPHYSDIMPSYLPEANEGAHSALSKKIIQYALFVSRQYEHYLAQQKKIPLYACIKLVDPEKIKELVPSQYLKDKITQTAFHITTKYFVDDADPIFLVKLSELNGKEIDLELTTILDDSYGTCMVVKHKKDAIEEDTTEPAGENKTDGYALDKSVQLTTDDYFKDVYIEKVFRQFYFPCNNAHPHITVANQKGVPPKYSNTLCEKYFAGEAVTAVELPKHTTVKGVFEFR
ncbi:hypothetical protein AGDE_10173 [Angomonas deanei]|uniref:Fungal tRNA ligase phosphodiesterase domain containing protein, putative n=1 Tax=Angomonas deanei TaxID=59799 RepID=A0A7G2CBZ1_9TRYP|nr:hypothetical protein AGDE_10173 [Angomonas deanei]CAD2217326.1 Fungal tRNA ligase phosphodiesterase domain containing protein, putative [Angomonas deanei]|eukprot:EPY29005.1 hypothetical protein AGDE_10173 [Angomonas deanei]